MNTTMIAQSKTADRMLSHAEWTQGFNAYMDGVSFDEEQSVNWRMGWRQAQVGEGECHRLDAVAYVEKQVHVLTDEECAAESADYHDWLEFQQDIEWSKR